MTRFSADETMAQLAEFQQATVEHVIARFFTDAEPTKRFLVADETGLGKSMVARGVVARTIEILQDDPKVDRIDVVYVCSNADIARQNVSRLNVTGQVVEVVPRLTLLARGSKHLDGVKIGERSRINLVSFTPGTLPGSTWKTGTIEERALLHLMVNEHFGLDRVDDRSSMLLFQGTVKSLDKVRYQVAKARLIADENGGIDQRIASRLIKRAEAEGLLDEYLQCLADTRGARTRLPSEVAERASDLIQRFRLALAHASVDALEPDLVILDEFQRFRDLVDGEATTDAAELAAALFNFPLARVLLLSATPVKAYTQAEEAASGDDHATDLASLLTFLCDGCSVDAESISHDLAAYRSGVIAGDDVSKLRDRIREQFISVMCRTERPVADEHRDFEEVADAVGPVPPADLAGWAALHGLAKIADAPVTLDYWKSVPYFANFLDGYQLGESLKADLTGVNGPESQHLAKAGLAGVQRLKSSAVARRKKVDLGNARLRRLAEHTLDGGLQELLWVPPSLPYEAPGGPFAARRERPPTKHLVFSSWSATPTAVSALLSFEALRRVGATGAATPRLVYSTRDGRASAMTTLAMCWPSPRLAEACDPRSLAAAWVQDEGQTGELISQNRLIAEASSAIADALPTGATSETSAAESAYWQTSIGLFGEPLDGLGDADVLVDALEPSTDSDLEDRAREIANEDEGRAGADNPRSLIENLRLHIETARDAIAEPQLDELPADLAETVAALGLHSPGNIAWRVLGRLNLSDDATTEGRWRAAAALGSGFRSLFNRPEAMAIIDRHTKQDNYWRAVLEYCGWGGLEAVLEEHLYHLVLAEGLTGPLDDGDLWQLALKVRAALSLRAATYRPFYPDQPTRGAALPGRFALRYGTARQADDSMRLSQLRTAFNSPFWPWVLATTSVGQEGIDLHWWCHSVVHWNTPSNPVDFEQREGRVNRFGSLHIRRNLAHRHGDALRATLVGNPWEHAYELGLDERDHLGELAPRWVYPGPSKVQRMVLPYPLSRDAARYRNIKGDLALYRLTFGQPRQEDFLDILKRQGVQTDPAKIKDLSLDLTPPRN